MRQKFVFILVGVGLTTLFFLDLVWGTIEVSVSEVLLALVGGSEEETSVYLIRNFRLPKALAAVLSGAGVSACGLMMQNLFRNPLADTSILGIGSGAGVGVACYTMAFTALPFLGNSSGVADTWGLVLSAFLGSLAVLLIITLVASWLQDIISVLIIGVMIGFIASSFISILQYLSDEEALKGYLLWSFASVSGITWRQLYVLAPSVLLGLAFVYMMPKYMNAMNLGESYTRSIGIDPSRVRLMVIFTTSLISGAITAFAGPIAFLGIAVPHFSRMAFGTSDHRVLIPATILLGAMLMLACDILTQVPGKMLVLPINALTSLIGAPVVIFVITRNRRKRVVFN
ncbi:MAG: iron ABC transporter permease [Porphyromonadaceae bacterium]|nr:iron ABC transporter permease [Porphyromonadaceae bacterium]